MGAEPCVRLGLLSLTQNGFVRVISQSGYPNSVTTPEAIRILGMATRQQEHAFWPDDSSITDSEPVPFGANSRPQASDRLIPAFIGGPKGGAPGDIRPNDSPVGGGRGQEQTPSRAVVGMDQCPEPTLSSDPPPIHAPTPFIAVDAEMLLGSPKEVCPSGLF